ncbi:PUA-like domain-containing protein [Clohesyomyces aquaticus]|uniref:PUA-like domain-containing protein n=1 Tax=Clohesyomyces aquaticus TaxID=1231657 RepID=A0A1Y1YYB8_9PLEO|nr:PUA-like domain-containing protein [Clohesyomyces aquaticus]
MVPNGSLSEKDPVALNPHLDARQLVRLVQCLRCSKPFTAPVTLLCGHTLCRTCLPEPRARANISYPNTADRQLGITCPFPTCQIEHPTGECSVDVTLTKLLDLVRVEMRRALSVEKTPLILQTTRPWSENSPFQEKPEAQDMGPKFTINGGRLAATFLLAEQGQLHHSWEVVYHSEASEEYEQLDVVLFERLREVAHKELDCQVCYNIMLDPTTTCCGHTFCRRCLVRVMDHSNLCPVCRRDFHVPTSFQNQHSNSRLLALLDGLCPDLVAARVTAVSLEEQPGEAMLDTPIFLCTLSLPTMPTFLHVFEPRYRLMMRRCVEGNKRFGMLMYNRSSSPQGELGSVRFMEYGTLLEIINYEPLPDGRSFVETRGISRFRVRDHGMLDGYNVGRVERVEDVSLVEEERLEAAETTEARQCAVLLRQSDPEAMLPPEVQLNMMSTQQLLDRCLQFVERMRARSAQWLSRRIVQVYGGPPNDPALFPYWFACVLPIAEEEKYLLLKTTRVRERLKMVNRWIARIEGQRWPSGGSCLLL